MIPYVDWIDQGNFWVRGSYNPFTDEEKAQGPLILAQHQRDILGHCLTPGLEKGIWRMPYTTIIYSAPKKSGKTTIGASAGAWFTDQAVANTESFCLAGDYEHAMGRMFDDLLFDAKYGREAFPNGKLRLKPTKDLLSYPDGKTIQAIAQEYKTASGSRHALTLWDELWSLVPGTRVLTADLRWVSVEEIKIGDKLASFDEEARPRHRQRHWQTGTVLGVGRKRSPIIELVLSTGENLRSTPIHKYLAREYQTGNKTVWRTAQDMVIGDKLPRYFKPWEEPKTIDEARKRGYMAAAYDGEGSLIVDGNRYRLEFAQNPNAMRETFLQYANEDGLQISYIEVRPGGCAKYRISRHTEVARTLGLYRPQRLMNKFNYGQLGVMHSIGDVSVVAINYLPDEEIIPICVDTKTYISEGYASHNTYISDSSRRLWVEMTPVRIPGVPTSLRFVSTYAGFEGESELLWDLYTQIVLEGEPVPELEHIQHASGEPTCWRNGRMFAYWDSAHRMPWQTEDYYLEQLASGMKPNEYARLHENRWTTASEPFMPISWWDKVAVLSGSLEYDVKNPRRQLPIIIGCDASTKHDSTAIVAVQYDYEADMLYTAFHRIWKPSPTEPMDFEHTLERYILERHNEGFQIAAIVYDPTQLHRSMTRLGTLLSSNIIQEFPQTLKNMTAASETLYNLFKNQKILVYKDDELREHLKHAMAEEKGRGFRIVKPAKAAIHHTDAAVALAMAAFVAYKTHGYDLSKPIVVEMPFGDSSSIQEKTPEQIQEEAHLPPQLRSGGMTLEEFEQNWKKHVKRDGTNA